MSAVVPFAVLRSELSKILTLRSCLAALALTFLVSVGLGGISGISVRSAIDNRSPMLEGDFTPEAAGFDALFYGLVAMVVFAVLLVTSEFSSGMIAQSLAAVPQRQWLYAAKLLAGAGVALLVAVPTVVLAYLATQAGLGPHGATMSSPTVGRALVGGVAFLVLTVLLCAGFAMVVRSPVVATAVLLPTFFVVSPLLNALEPTRRVAQYLPDRMGMQMVATGQVTEGLSPTSAGLVMLAWAGAAVAAGAFSLHRLEV